MAAWRKGRARVSVSVTTIVLGLVAVVGAVLLAVAKTLITDEVKGWLPHASKSLVNRAVDLLPPEHQDRWREEWQSDLEEYTRDERRLAGLEYAVQVLHAATAMRKSFSRQLEPEAVESARANEELQPGRDRLRSYITVAAAAVSRARGRLTKAGSGQRATITVRLDSPVFCVLRGAAQAIGSLGHDIRELVWPIASLAREVAFLLAELGKTASSLARALVGVDHASLRVLSWMMSLVSAAVVGIAMVDIFTWNSGVIPVTVIGFAIGASLIYFSNSWR